MTKMNAGIVQSHTGLDGIEWNILGQKYIPKAKTEDCFSWHASLPPGTFVPPHIHPDQDEYGDIIKLPRGIPHGIFNKSDQTIKTLFWVTPTGQLFDLFWALHNLGPEADPAEVVAVSAAHAIDFLPPGKSK